MSQPPSEVPPPPPAPQPSPLPGPPPATQPAVPTRIAGQETIPQTAVPYTPGAPAYQKASGATNSLAVISLGCGIGSFFAHLLLPGWGGGALALTAIITGFAARSQIKQSGERGQGYATAGIIIGFIHLALIALVVLLIIFVVLLLGVAFLGFHR